MRQVQSRWRLAAAATVGLAGFILTGCGETPARAAERPTGANMNAEAGANAVPATGGNPGPGETAPTEAAAPEPTPATAGAPAAKPGPAPTITNPKGIYAVSPVYTIMAGGQVLERADGKFGALAKQNNAFDGAGNTVHFYGAQNQEVAVQLVIPWTGKSFSAQAGTIDQIPVDRVTFSWIAYDAVSHPDKNNPKKTVTENFPDVIVPLDGSIAGIKAFNVPQDLTGLPKVDSKQGLILMEIWIPKTATAGTHAGTVSILEGGAVAATLKVEVHVTGVLLPDAPTFRLDYLNYSSPLKNFGLDSALGDGAATDLATSAEGIQLEQSLYAQLLDNRGFLNVLPYASQRGNGMYGYPIKGEGTEAKISSFQGFDARYGDLLSGKLGKYKVAPACFTLPFNINYPFTSQSETKHHFDFRPFHKNVPEGPGKEPKLKKFEDTWRSIGQQMTAHFAEKGWKHTAFELYNNQKPADNNRSPWKLDEPVEADDYKGLRYLLNVGKWAFEGADAKGVQVIGRVDIGHWECERLKTLDGKLTADYKAKEFNSGNAEKVLKPVVDRWVAGYTHVQGAQWLIPEYNTDKVMFDTYGGAGETISHGGMYVGSGWVCNGIGVEGKVIYKTTYAPPTQVVDDTTVYSAKGLGAQAGLVSRRVKLWRDAVNDYDLLELAKKKDPAAVKALLAQLLKLGPAANQQYREQSHTIETYFDNNVEDVVVAERMVRAIAAGDKSADGLKLDSFSKEYVGCGAPDTIVGYD